MKRLLILCIGICLHYVAGVVFDIGIEHANAQATGLTYSRFDGRNYTYQKLDFSKINIVRNGDLYAVTLPFTVPVTPASGELFWLAICVPDESSFSSWGIHNANDVFICQAFDKYTFGGATYIIQAQPQLTEPVRQGRYTLKINFSKRPSMNDVQLMVGYSTQAVFDNLKNYYSQRAESTTTANNSGSSVSSPSSSSSSPSRFANFTETRNNLNIEMIAVKGGTFTMGCTSEQGNDCEDNEKPAHRVTVDDFYIGKYEITQAQWKAVMGYNDSYYRGDSLPVDGICWYEAEEFVKKLSALTGKPYRFPTEAEWEFAARVGNNSKGYKYSGSNSIDEVAWYAGNRKASPHAIRRYDTDPSYDEDLIKIGSTQAVGKKAPNELGIYDMSGNVNELCKDGYGPYSSNAQTDPQGADIDYEMVYRGGNWRWSATSARVSFRDSWAPEYVYDNVGFRLACSVK